ncbi:DNA cytosine methyltransferase [Spirillospora sp. NPDC048911]|uniref:DNA cytosine methyltransferase n=1 Tax=Spirillospora sp. NPDC048911 TaxID=3364527 RepID=UPI00372363AD
MALTVVDLFSGGGGASSGFHANPNFKIVGAADAQLGKPSTGAGTLACNSTYSANMGITPEEVDLGVIDPDELGQRFDLESGLDVLVACPPCTGFSRTLSKNHIEDDSRNSLVGRTAEFASVFQPDVLVMENARELVMGRFNKHLVFLVQDLEKLGYKVHYGTHFLSEFGLPQKRERALVVAVKGDLPLLTMRDLWDGYSVDPKATHVRRAIWSLPSLEAGAMDPNDPMHTAPSIRDEAVWGRLKAIPHDGGSWFDLAGHPRASQLLTPTMIDRLNRNALGSHPDVYGRMWWDRPAPTIKRECSHVGNGRYSHPEQDRLCSVREMGILNGFPANYVFQGSVSNMYRHIGDAVPPLISYQLAALVTWILGSPRPGPEELILPKTHLSLADITRTEKSVLF